MANVTTTDPFYQKYYGAGFSLPLVGLALPQFCLDLVAVLLNSSLVYVTWKCRHSLNAPFNLLMGFESLLCCLWQSCYLTCFLIPLSGLNYINVVNCYFLQFTKIFGVNAQIVTMMFIGVERALCIACPVWAKKNMGTIANPYLWLYIGLASFYGGANCVLSYVGMIQNLLGREVLCMSGDYQASWAQTLNFRVNLGFELVTVAMYAYIWGWVICGARNGVNVISTVNWRILKSLSLIVGFIVVGWMSFGLSSFYVPLLDLSTEGKFYLNLRLTNLSIVAASSNAPILYIFTADYCRCYRKTFSCLLGPPTDASTQMPNRGVNVSRSRVGSVKPTGNTVIQLKPNSF